MKLNRKAAQHGRIDARTFADEHPEHVAKALEPGQEAPDESLINALLHVGVAKLFRVSWGKGRENKAFWAACGNYNEAFLGELRRLAPAATKRAVERARAEREALDAAASASQ